MLTGFGGKALGWLSGGLGTKVLLGFCAALLVALTIAGYSLRSAVAEQAVASSQRDALVASIEQLHAAKQRQADAYAENRRALLALERKQAAVTKEIRDAPDPAGCADQPVAPAIRLLLD